MTKTDFGFGVRVEEADFFTDSSPHLSLLHAGHPEWNYIAQLKQGRLQKMKDDARRYVQHTHREWPFCNAHNKPVELVWDEEHEADQTHYEGYFECKECGQDMEDIVEEAHYTEMAEQREYVRQVDELKRFDIAAADKMALDYLPKHMPPVPPMLTPLPKKDVGWDTGTWEVSWGDGTTTTARIPTVAEAAANYQPLNPQVFRNMIESLSDDKKDGEGK